MIPEFPKFTKLDLDHKSVVEEFFTQFPAYSEFGFANMFVWDTVQPVMLSILNKNLIIQFVDFKTKSYYLTIIGTNELDDTIKTLSQYAIEHGHDPELHTVPEHVLKHIRNPHEFEIVEDLDSNDYIISIPFLAKMEGKKLEDKRHKINQFTKNYESHSTFRKLDLSNPVHIKSMNAIIEKWLPKDGHTPQDIIIELTAIMKSIKHHEFLDLEAYGVEVNGVLEAFTIIEKVHGKMVIGHFEKGNKEYTGIYEYMNHHLSRHLHEEGFEYLNICQDLGIEGLRKSKLSYSPEAFHRKYSIKPRSTITHPDKVHIQPRLSVFTA